MILQASCKLGSISSFLQDNPNEHGWCYINIDSCIHTMKLQAHCSICSFLQESPNEHGWCYIFSKWSTLTHATNQSPIGVNPISPDCFAKLKIFYNTWLWTNGNFCLCQFKVDLNSNIAATKQDIKKQSENTPLALKYNAFYLGTLCINYYNFSGCEPLVLLKYG